MATPINYRYFKYSVNGKTYVDAGAYSNTPAGYTEITLDEFVPLAKAMPNPENGWTGKGSYWDSLTPEQRSGGPSSLVIGPNGNQMKKEDAENFQPSPQELAQGVKPTGKYATGDYVTLANGAVVPKDSSASTNPPTTGGSTSTTQTTVATPPSTTSATQPPMTALQTGATGDSVKQLQDWLVSQNYMTHDQVNTGYGIYGPATTSAVAKWQTDHGVENSSGVGQWGPKSIAAFQTTTKNTNTSSNTSNSTSSDANQPIPPPAGVDPALWGRIDPGTQAAIAGMGSVLMKQLEQNQPVPVALTTEDLDALYKQAQSDPVIAQYYGERLRTGQQQFQQDLSYLQGGAGDQARQQQMQFESDRKALAEQHAAAGTAYSGFRGQAQQKLGDLESGIVQSSRRNLQKQLTDATQAFETKYGTSATNPATAQFQDPYQASNYSLSSLYKPSGGPMNTLLTGTTIGNVAGSEKQAALGDTEQQYQDLINKSLLMKGATA